ncbi:hypothetical protein NSI01_55270 [Pimelobacter simplex]|nr:hypothetical protein NSI01_55270 [Pimelobacter simplex]
MAQPPFAEVSDLAAWVGQEIPAEDPRATAVLLAASQVVIAEVGPKVAEDWAEVPGDVSAITAQVAARVWFNPQGLIADSIDDYSRRWDQGGESGIYLTSGERDLLSKYRTKAKGLWALGTTRGDDCADQYLDVVNADTPGTLEEPIPFLPPGA